MLVKLRDARRQESYNEKIINHSALFNPEWYQSNYSIDGTISLANHYLQVGWRLGYDPSEVFSTNIYLEINQDVKEGNVNPLLHYETSGRKEGRKYRYNDEENVIRNSAFFDYKWYKEKYHLDEDENSVVHYLTVGWKLGYDPSERFSTNMYFSLNKDIDRKNVNPLLHYEESGKKEGRHYKYGAKELFIRNSEFFDCQWYKNKYQLDGNEDPVIHYLTIGWKLGYDPSENFSTNQYFLANSDIDRENMNPLLHYEMVGRNENRSIKYNDQELIINNSEFFDCEWYKRKYLNDNKENPVTHFLYIGWKLGYNPSPWFSTEDYFSYNQDISDINPLLHYEMYGREEFRMFKCVEGLEENEYV